VVPVPGLGVGWAGTLQVQTWPARVCQLTLGAGAWLPPVVAVPLPPVVAVPLPPVVTVPLLPAVPLFPLLPLLPAAPGTDLGVGEGTEAGGVSASMLPAGTLRSIVQWAPVKFPAVLGALARLWVSRYSGPAPEAAPSP